MCGIAGIVYRDPERRVAREELVRMCRTLVYRGPDEEGYFVAGNVGLGARRLSIIDLDSGQQPMSSEDGRAWIVFNGEIYNFQDLRRELESLGHVFKTHSDTEVILHAYEEFGEDCVHHLNGMFAFAIWDGRRRNLFLARDRLGVKPLYVYEGNELLAFGSEIKALLTLPAISRRLDLEALDTFLTLEYIPSPLTIFEGISKLPASHVLTFDGNKISHRQYWDLKPQPRDRDPRELQDELLELIEDAVRIRMVADVPVGAFLSGGIDSSTVVYWMKQFSLDPPQTFSIGFRDPSYDESEYAELAARHLGTVHHSTIISPDVVQLTEKITQALDEPMADVSVFPTYLLSRFARQGVKVVLSGDGGDEIFGGYDWYLADRMYWYYGKLPVALRRRWIPSLVQRLPPTSKKKGIVNKVGRFVMGTMLPEHLRHFRWNVYLDEHQKRQLYSVDLIDHLSRLNGWRQPEKYLERWEGSDPLFQQQYADINTFLVDDILVKVDRMSMANSLEVRSPLLDFRLVEFSVNLPQPMKIRGLRRKILLKKSMEKKLPYRIINREKQGFSIPMKNWLRRELAPMLRDFLSPSRIQRTGLFNAEHVQRLASEHLNGKFNHAHQLWPLLLFEIWNENFLH